MKKPTTMGARAKARREELGLTRTEVARRVERAGKQGAKIQNIRQLEDGDVQAITYLAELSIALECDPIWLATGTKPKRSARDIDPELLAIAWDAANVVTDEHGLKWDRVRLFGLALQIYETLTGAPQEPDRAAREALLRLLADRQKRQET